MAEYFEPAALKFIIVFTVVALIVVMSGIVFLVKQKNTDRLKGLFPVVDSILVTAGFMAFTGTGLALIQSAGKIAHSKISDEPAFLQSAEKWSMTISPKEWDFIFKEMLRASHTVLLAGLIFFILFEAWLVLRLLYRKKINKTLLPLNTEI
jgi:hypothetical protein